MNFKFKNKNIKIIGKKKKLFFRIKDINKILSNEILFNEQNYTLIKIMFSKNKMTLKKINKKYKLNLKYTFLESKEKYIDEACLYNILFNTNNQNSVKFLDFILTDIYSFF